MQDSLAAIAKSPDHKNKTIASGNKLGGLVAGPFFVDGLGYLWVLSYDYVVKPWYFQIPFLKAWLESVWDKKHPDKKNSYPAWICNVNHYQVREPCDPTNKIMLKQDGYPIQHVGTTFATKTNDQGELMKQIKEFDSYRKKIFTHDDSEGQIGEWFYSHLKRSNLQRIIDGMNRYMPMETKARIKHITNDFKVYGTNVHEYNFGHTLDRFWSDYSIKEFVKKWYNVYSFNDVDEDVLKQCFNNYPDKRDLPVWNDIIEQYSRGN